MKTNYYAAHSRELRGELLACLDREALRALHLRRPSRHFLIMTLQYLLLILGITGVFFFHGTALWLPFAILEGIILFDFTILLHEVLHGLVFPRHRPIASRILELLYALPSGLSPTQFTRWHLDHHAELGSGEGDPKRHYLSPRINRRWFKALYFTPALFVIYFRAVAREVASYPRTLRVRIAAERAVAILLQLSLVLGIWRMRGWELVFKAYLVPLLVVFPVAFAVNRLGQHYDINPEDPACWTTLVKPSRFWDLVYLWSSYHLEHHYFPGVPFYNLPALHRLLEPFFMKRGMKKRSYAQLLYLYLIKNKQPHTNWELE